MHAWCHGMSARALGRASLHHTSPRGLAPWRDQVLRATSFHPVHLPAVPSQGRVRRTKRRLLLCNLQLRQAHCIAFSWAGDTPAPPACCPCGPSRTLLDIRRRETRAQHNRLDAFAAGFADCNSDGSCIATTPTDNCGGCGRTCPSDAVGCDGAMCLCPDGESRLDARACGNVQSSCSGRCAVCTLAPARHSQVHPVFACSNDAVRG